MKLALILFCLCTSSVFAQKEGLGWRVYLDIIENNKCEKYGYSLSPGETFYDNAICQRVFCGEDFTFGGDVCWNGDESDFCFEDVEATGEQYPDCCTKTKVPCV